MSTDVRDEGAPSARNRLGRVWLTVAAGRWLVQPPGSTQLVQPPGGNERGRGARRARTKQALQRSEERSEVPAACRETARALLSPAPAAERPGGFQAVFAVTDSFTERPQELPNSSLTNIDETYPNSSRQPA